MGGCFSFYQGLSALRRDGHESPEGYTAGLVVLGVALVAEAMSRIDLAPGIDSERVEEVSMRVREAVADRWPQADQVFLDITHAPPRAAR